jgi:hypothetical protein
MQGHEDAQLCFLLEVLEVTHFYQYSIWGHLYVMW